MEIGINGSNFPSLHSIEPIHKVDNSFGWTSHDEMIIMLIEGVQNILHAYSFQQLLRILWTVSPMVIFGRREHVNMDGTVQNNYRFLFSRVKITTTDDHDSNN